LTQNLSQGIGKFYFSFPSPSLQMLLTQLETLSATWLRSTSTWQYLQQCTEALLFQRINLQFTLSLQYIKPILTLVHKTHITVQGIAYQFIVIRRCLRFKSL